EKLYRDHRDEGLVVLGFPCNQFGGQEPGSAEEIRDFCSTTYDVDFPMFAKIAVNGEDEHPLFHELKAQQGGLFGKRIKWNFSKFLVDREGVVQKRYAPQDKPEKIAADLPAYLQG